MTNRFEKYFIPQPIEPNTKTCEEIRLEWAIGLIAMQDLEKDHGFSIEQANEERHKFITQYILDLRSSTDFAQQNRSMVVLYWNKTIKAAKELSKQLMLLNGDLDESGVSDTVDHLTFQREIELDLLF